MQLKLLISMTIFLVSCANAQPKTFPTTVRYNCNALSTSQAQNLYKHGHKYLDSNKNNIPCDEMPLKKITPQKNSKNSKIMPKK